MSEPQSLPVLPAAHARALVALRDEDVAIAEVAAIVETDTNLTVQLTSKAEGYKEEALDARALWDCYLVGRLSYNPDLPLPPPKKNTGCVAV